MPLHPASPPALRRVASVAAVLGLLVLITFVLPDGFRNGMTAYHDFLHSFQEILSLVLAGSILAIVWSAADERVPAPLSVLAAGALLLGVLDFAHLMSATTLFGLDSDPQLSVAFASFTLPISALLLLSSALMRWTRVTTRGRRQLLWPALWGATLAALFAFWLVLGLMPACGWFERFAEIRVGTDLVTVLLGGLASLLFFRQRHDEYGEVMIYLGAAAAFTAFEASLFASPMTQATAGNVLAHCFKLAAFLCVFQAVCVAAVRRPYGLLHSSERRLEASLKALPDLLIEMNGEGRYLAVLGGNTAELSLPLEELIGKGVDEVLSEPAAATAMAAIAEARRCGIARGKLIRIRIAGEQHWFELSVVATLGGAVPGDERFLVASRDVSERESQRQRLQMMSLAVEQSPAAVVITDDQVGIQYVNEAFTQSTGYELEEIVGLHPRFLHAPSNPRNLEQLIEDCLLQGRHWSGEIVCLTKDGREFTESVLFYAVHDDRGRITNFLAIKEDISARIEAAESIRQLSRYDQLTGLPNRQLLGEMFAQLREESQMVAALWIDIDHFKDVNDALGHSLGDLLLQEVARRLRSSLRIQDALCRVSGDDFVVLLAGADQQQAALMSRRLIQAMFPPVTLGMHQVSVTASVGIALCPEDALSLEALIQKAEIAMYRMKQSGRNNYSFFAAEMQDRAIRMLTLSNALKQALPRDEFHLVYQPQLALEDNRIIGAEVLLRWNYPRWGPVSPAEFIPIAEASGQIVAIGEWVLRTALKQLRCWLDQGHDICLAVNLSAVQFEHGGLTELLNHLLCSHAVPAARLELELTEAVAMNNPELAAQRMTALRQLGVKLAIDDFGTGYSSLSYLKRFKIHKLKIDQSFVRDIEEDADDRAIATAIIQMAHGLGMKTIAEGVESSEQLAWLRAQQCDQIQGYHLSRPLLAADFETFLRAQEER